MTGPFPFQTFDPTEDVFITERHLPHWAQANTLCFMTFRTWDSMPGDVVRRWEADRADLLRAHGINPLSNSWKDELEQLDPLDRKVLKQRLSDRWQGSLDECHGECVLRSPKFAAIVADSLRHFDGERYHLTDFVVMPNHVHVMASFVEPEQMLSQAESWRHFTATKINRLLGRRGRFWQQDGFDHLVRSTEQFEYLRRYIAENPSNARLTVGEFLHESKELKPDSNTATLAP